MIKLLTTSVFKGQILEYLKVVATINQETIIYILYVRNRLFKRNTINVALGCLKLNSSRKGLKEMVCFMLKMSRLGSGF